MLRQRALPRHGIFQGTNLGEARGDEIEAPEFDSDASAEAETDSGDEDEEEDKEMEDPGRGQRGG